MKLTNTLTLERFGATRNGRALADPLSLELLPGTVLGVVGPNGVGKSSLLAAAAGAGVASFGEVKFAGEVLRSLSATRRSRIISMLSQDTRAPHELLVRELVEIGALAGGHRGARADQAVAGALEHAGVSHLSDVRFGALSGGQQQLVQIARVLAQDTPVVMLDEPTSALDLFHQRVVEQTMRRLGNDGKIVIAALHDLSLALNACTQVLLLDRGGSAYTGNPAEVLRADLVHHAYGVHTEIHETPGGRRYLATTDHASASRDEDATTPLSHSLLEQRKDPS